MYGTSKHFLEFFGLKDLGALPTLKEFSALDPDFEAGVNSEDADGQISPQKENAHSQLDIDEVESTEE
jgi:segregation and condensation protein B